MNEKRMGRISQEIKKAISQAVFFELKDPKIAEVLTISDVTVSSDLSYADIFVSVMGSEWDKRQTLEGLENAQGFLKNYLAHHVKIRQVPVLRFHPDSSIEHGMYMDQLIAETLKKDQESRAAREQRDQTQETGQEDGEEL